MIPAVGGTATASRWARRADNAVDAARGITRYGDELADAARAGTRYGDEVATATGRQADEVVGAACSFSEDTPVATESGFVPIGELDVGELVLAWDQALDETDFYTVTAVWAHLDSSLVTLTIDDEQIETTPEHPFYIADNAWVAAGELWLGARVKKADGGYGTVKAISVVEAPQVMYNLTVEGAHTYHVGREGWLVHNTCPSPIARGGADIENLTPGQRNAIQRFSDRRNVEVTVVGSRASGTAGPDSDWDYLIGSNSRTRQRARQELPRGTSGGELNPSGTRYTGLDVFNANLDTLDETKPHIIFYPRPR